MSAAVNREEWEPHPIEPTQTQTGWLFYAVTRIRGVYVPIAVTAFAPKSYERQVFQASISRVKLAASSTATRSPPARVPAWRSSQTPPTGPLCWLKWTWRVNTTLMSLTGSYLRYRFRAKEWLLGTQAPQSSPSSRPASPMAPAQTFLTAGKRLTAGLHCR